MEKTFLKSILFLYEILHFLLSSFPSKPGTSGFERTKNVLLADASVVRQNGKKQEHIASKMTELVLAYK